MVFLHSLVLFWSHLAVSTGVVGPLLPIDTGILQNMAQLWEGNCGGELVWVGIYGALMRRSVQDYLIKFATKAHVIFENWTIFLVYSFALESLSKSKGATSLDQSG